MNEDYAPTPLEQDLIDAYWLLCPHVELENYSGIDKTCRSVGAIGHELYTSLIRSGYKIEIDPNLVKNRELQPDHEEFFTQVHCAVDLLSKLPPRTNSNHG